jgi:hypothetical protein
MISCLPFSMKFTPLVSELEQKKELMKEEVYMEQSNYTTPTSLPNNKVLLDTGASNHMTPLSISDGKSVNACVCFGNGTQSPPSKLGLLSVGKHLKIQALHVPELTATLISVSRLLYDGYDVLFSLEGAVVINSSGTESTEFPLRDGLFVFEEENETCDNPPLAALLSHEEEIANGTRIDVSGQLELNRIVSLGSTD